MTETFMFGFIFFCKLDETKPMLRLDSIFLLSIKHNLKKCSELYLKLVGVSEIFSREIL